MERRAEEGPSWRRNGARSLGLRSPRPGRQVAGLSHRPGRRSELLPAQGPQQEAATGRRGVRGDLPDLEEGLPRAGVLRAETNNLKRKRGRGACKGPEADHGGGNWIWGPGFYFIPGRVGGEGHVKLKNFCKPGRAGCPNLQKLPKGDTEARTI